MNSLFQKNNPKRHKILSDRFNILPKSSNEKDAVSSPEDLNAELETLKTDIQSAIELEHSTIPPYLCALYSIKDGANDYAANTIKSIVLEEMLHMIMAANILNAIGGSPAINTPDFIPEYPTKLPEITEDFYVSLGKFSKDSIDTFLKIEKSAEHQPHEGNEYHSIGEFYASIKRRLKRLNKAIEGGIFTGKPELQITSEQYYGSGGKLVSVYCLADAILAIDEIVGQGEGIDGEIEDPDHELFGEGIEYAHYFRFNEIYHEQKYRPRDSPQEPPTGKPITVDWDAVYNMQDNPKMANFPQGSEIWQKSYNFNKTYMALLDNIHNACNGNPQLLMQGIALMYDLKYKALELMKIPIVEGSNITVGPSFEYVE